MCSVIQLKINSFAECNLDTSVIIHYSCVANEVRFFPWHDDSLLLKGV